MVICYIYTWRNGTHLLWLWIFYSSGLFCFVLFWGLWVSYLKNCPTKDSFFSVYNLMSNFLLLSKAVYSLSLQDIYSYIKLVKPQPTCRAIKDDIYISLSEAPQPGLWNLVFKVVMNARERVKTLYCPIRNSTYF